MPAPVPPAVFVGGVGVSRECLEALCDEGLAPALVVGYDASRAGASGFVDMCAVAARHGIPCVAAPDVNDPALVARMADLRPAIVWVIGWSQLVRRPILDLPEHGCVGIHPTDLPDGRGRAPIPWTILKGHTATASTMFLLTEGVDDGDVIGRRPIEVTPREDAGTLYAKHSDAHVALVRAHARDLLAGTASAAAQDHARATVWPGRRPEDGRIDWSAPAADVDRLVRAVTRPFPGAFSESAAERVTIWRGEPIAGATPPGPAGTVVRRGGDVLVACSTGALRVVDADGPLTAGDRLG